MGEYAIEVAPPASRQLRKLPPQVQVRILAAFDQLAQNPRHPGCEKLEGGSNTYRVRVGDYRVVYEIQDRILVVVVVRVAHRRHVYDR